MICANAAGPLEMVVAKRASGDKWSSVQILAAVVRRDGVRGMWSLCDAGEVSVCVYQSWAHVRLLRLDQRRLRKVVRQVLGAAVLAWAADLTVEPIVHPIETVAIRLNRSETGERAGELVPRMLRTEGIGTFLRVRPK